MSKKAKKLHYFHIQFLPLLVILALLCHLGAYALISLGAYFTDNPFVENNWYILFYLANFFFASLPLLGFLTSDLNNQATKKEIISHRTTPLLFSALLVVSLLLIWFLQPQVLELRTLGYVGTGFSILALLIVRLAARPRLIKDG